MQSTWDLMHFNWDNIAAYPSTKTASNTLCCAWCKKDLSMATQVMYLNGNQPVCDLCLSVKLIVLPEP